jgi:hypothetical protein
MDPDPATRMETGGPTLTLRAPSSSPRLLPTQPGLNPPFQSNVATYTPSASTSTSSSTPSSTPSSTSSAPSDTTEPPQGPFREQYHNEGRIENYAPFFDDHTNSYVTANGERLDPLSLRNIGVYIQRNDGSSTPDRELPEPGFFDHEYHYIMDHYGRPVDTSLRDLNPEAHGNGVAHTDENRAYARRPNDFAIDVRLPARLRLDGQAQIDEQARLAEQERLEQQTRTVALLLPLSREPAHNIRQRVNPDIANRRILGLYITFRNYQQILLWQPPETYRRGLIEILGRIFPGLNAPGTLQPSVQPFRLEASIPHSNLLLQIFISRRTSDQWATRPKLTFDQLIALALLAQPDRTADDSEIISWITAAYPWFREHLFYSRLSSSIWRGVPSYLSNHIRDYLRTMNHRVGTVFTPINPASRERGVTYIRDYAGRVWYLPTGAENRIFRELYSNPEHATWDPTPWQLPDLNVQRSLLTLPVELQQRVLNHLLVLDGTIFVVYDTTSPPTIQTTPQYFVPNPEWMINAADRASVISLDPRLAPHVWIEGRQIPGRFIDPTAMLSDVNNIDPSLGLLAIEAFYGRNTFSVIPDYVFSRRGYPAGYHDSYWLRSLTPLIRASVRQMELRLQFNRRQQRSIEPLLRILGARLDPHVTLIINRNSLSQQQLVNPSSIPGMNILRRFRGCRHIRIVSNPPIPALDALVQSWVTRRHFQSNPTQALLDRVPPSVATLQGRTRHGLQLTARQYGYNPSTYNRLPDGGDPSARLDLALFIYAEQMHEYYDAMDNQVLPLRQRPTPTARQTPVAPLQPPTPVVPAVQWMRDHEINRPSPPQISNNNGNSDIPANEQDENQDTSPPKRKF